MIIESEPGMTVRAYRLDGTSVEGVAESGPVRRLRGGITADPVVLRGHDEEFDHTLVEPAGETLANWKGSHVPRVSWHSLAYKILDDLLDGARWSGHMGEYVHVDWRRHEVTADLKQFVGRGDGASRIVDASTFLEALAPALWTFADERIRRVSGAVTRATEHLRKRGGTLDIVGIPPWAADFVPEFPEGVWVCTKTPYPMVLSHPHEGMFEPVLGLTPNPRGW